ncbi:hypothetical protein PA598K_03820 [Paenibacillus sp. 598K]|uniref:hypothetical protein n=1 Tax=Paenibacillus sp. 598K TaxID=1117987 RepID=UPI000FF90D0A|nr:hypothetical protein [Paenibacillus sp. 598K]GBF75409.1 hypothetical protein PA598K_03820 [Paenibacillus sp. 598K]
MQEEQPVKRSWFTGVVVVLLVASLTYSVFLFSHKLQNDQREKALRGERIITSAWDTRLYTEMIIENTRKLLDTDDLGERIAAKQALGYTFGGYPKGVQAFIGAAQDIEPRELPGHQRNALTFLSQIELSVRSIGNHDQPLSPEERAYLEDVVSLYERMHAEINRFGVTQTTQQESLLVLSELEWVDMAYAILDMMNEPEGVLFEGVNAEDAAQTEAAQ